MTTMVGKHFLAYRIEESLDCQCMENLIFHPITLNSSSVYQHNTQAMSSDCHLSAWTTSGLAT